MNSSTNDWLYDFARDRLPEAYQALVRADHLIADAFRKHNGPDVVDCTVSPIKEAVEQRTALLGALAVLAPYARQRDAA